MALSENEFRGMLLRNSIIFISMNKHLRPRKSKVVLKIKFYPSIHEHSVPFKTDFRQ